MGNHCSRHNPHKRYISKEEQEIVRKKKMDQGFHECEVTGGGPEGAESNYLWGECKKYPKHTKFIPVHEFNLKHLPKQCRRQSLLEVVRTTALVTAKLRVNYTSDDRKPGCAFYSSRGLPITHTGSGWVRKVKLGEGPCPCGEDCPQRSEPWYKLRLYSACHVVYDIKEARATEAHFFYDDEDSDVKTVKGLEISNKDEEGDLCELVCVTHDGHLAQRLTDAVDERKRALDELQKEECEPSDLGYELCIIVSHPHGKPKKVTVGKVVERKDMTCSYSTHTCSGSSGAPVFTLEYFWVGFWQGTCWLHPHKESRKRRNLSGHGQALRFMMEKEGQNMNKSESQK